MGLRRCLMRSYRVDEIGRSLWEGHDEMLEQALAALAAAGGAAVVQAAGTDAWAGLRQALAGWFGRGDQQRERAELERLDRTAGELDAAAAGAVERLRMRQEGVWQTRVEILLENLEEAEQIHAAESLRALLARHAPRGGVSAGRGGLAVGGNVEIRAEGGSIAAGVINAGAHVGGPAGPDPSEG
ncbi:hypothetical protein [Streptomyces katrae]|uniref:hypothetical protein n=1 Tax=Streptomyces katrae TaxID=68223 RepID=UPI000A4F0BD6|nr:hypothetical protein [Streptomyces katrae]